MIKNNYSVEFKVRAVELLRSSGRTQEQVAKELGIAESSLHKWSKQYDSGKFSRTPGKVQSSSEREIARLTAELKRKTLEVEILKKATAFFAKESA
jgi:transposase